MPEDAPGNPGALPPGRVRGMQAKLHRWAGEDSSRRFGDLFNLVCDLGNDGEKIRVKARVVSEPAEPGQLQLSPFRSFGFDAAVIVLLSAADYAVSRASKVPRHVVESAAVYRQHVNGSVLIARPEIMGHPEATDLTATLRAAQSGRENV